MHEQSAGLVGNVFPFNATVCCSWDARHGRCSSRDWLLYCWGCSAAPKGMRYAPGKKKEHRHAWILRSDVICHPGCEDECPYLLSEQATTTDVQPVDQLVGGPGCPGGVQGLSNSPPRGAVAEIDHTRARSGGTAAPPRPHVWFQSADSLARCSIRSTSLRKSPNMQALEPWLAWYFCLFDCEIVFLLCGY